MLRSDSDGTIFADGRVQEDVMHQLTIRKAIECSGIGLHSGRKVSLSLRPADEDSGIIFIVTGSSGERMLKPAPDGVVCTGLATTLGQGDCRVATVEHLLAAIRGMGIDNIIVQTDGGEIPIMDGSAASFVLLLKNAGIRTQSAPKRILALKKDIVFEREDKWIKARPARGFAVNYAISFDHPLVGRQKRRFSLSDQDFARHIARARTFGFLRDVEHLQKHGLALGGSLENAVVLDEYGVVNPEGLRFEDEFVRHKILDFIGDMALLDYPLWGSFSVYCSGHALNNEFLRYLSANRDEYLELVTLSDARGREAQSVEKGKVHVPVWA
jgi:UDP-3-O-[3-hydroxymyristoyl] N-acetylglucosamine deacetylase